MTAGCVLRPAGPTNHSSEQAEGVPCGLFSFRGPGSPLKNSNSVAAGLFCRVLRRQTSTNLRICLRFELLELNKTSAASPGSRSSTDCWRGKRRGSRGVRRARRVCFLSFLLMVPGARMWSQHALGVVRHFHAGLGERNSKHEIRNPKQIRRVPIQNPLTVGLFG